MSSPPFHECYCGAVDDDTCFDVDVNAPQGLCKAAMNTAQPGGPLSVAAVYYDATTGVGAAIQETNCRAALCATECDL